MVLSTNLCVTGGHGMLWIGLLLTNMSYVRVTLTSDIQATAFRKMPSLSTLFLVLHQPIEDEYQTIGKEQGNSETLLRPSLASEQS
jgi:hypothetical protein